MEDCNEQQQAMFQFDMGSLCSTREAERTSNLLLEVFQNASSKWNTTCVAPQIASKNYEANKNAQFPQLSNIPCLARVSYHPEQTTCWNSSSVGYGKQEMNGHGGSLVTVAQDGSHRSSSGSNLSASLDPAPLPSLMVQRHEANSYPFQQEEQPLPTTAKTRDLLLKFLQQNSGDVTFAKESSPMPKAPTTLASVCDAAWSSRFPAVPEPSPLPMNAPFCPPTNSGADESYEMLQKLFMASPLNKGGPLEQCQRGGSDTFLNAIHDQSERRDSATRQRTNDYPTMESPLDEIYLNSFHCFLRKQIVIFEATHEDIGKIQGRNKGLALHQVGLGCRYCTPFRHTDRSRGVTYHPTQLSTIYQTAQNLVKNHFFRNCPNMPPAVKEELKVRSNRITKKLNHRGGGKQYWSNVLQISGIVEVDGGLFYKE
ncbi:hypothetical protein FisN_13Lh349 [Fistulifera solaris]|uniref:Uncharacterized protein n=1 Tax=Fistulifera solaris TaxID=1519565 RepID=A0A1Z5KME2_FISSO|nr:hypothetical protein FisN_13Lh349 [Fistulifera solaris]|eukprot:GAX27108.1 hypothetical protein FisN_13Lh349 [Fistulifera solaris]